MQFSRKSTVWIFDKKPPQRNATRIFPRHHRGTAKYERSWRIVLWSLGSRFDVGPLLWRLVQRRIKLGSFKGKFTGKPYIFGGENHGFLKIFPEANPLIDKNNIAECSRTNPVRFSQSGGKPWKAKTQFDTCCLLHQILLVAPPDFRNSFSLGLTLLEDIGRIRRNGWLDHLYLDGNDPNPSIFPSKVPGMIPVEATKGSAATPDARGVRHGSRAPADVWQGGPALRCASSRVAEDVWICQEVGLLSYLFILYVIVIIIHFCNYWIAIKVYMIVIVTDYAVNYNWLNMMFEAYPHLPQVGALLFWAPPRFMALTCTTMHAWHSSCVLQCLCRSKAGKSCGSWTFWAFEWPKICWFVEAEGLPFCDDLVKSRIQRHFYFMGWSLLMLPSDTLWFTSFW